MTVQLKDIEAARKAISDAIQPTPCVYSATLSKITGAKVYLKMETAHFTASFKERGALNKLLTLDAKTRKHGVIAMSAGNHAQAVAYHATRLGIPSTIVMPSYTPTVKVKNTGILGANVELVGDDLDEARNYAVKLGKEKALSFVHPYDDRHVIAGQGTLALEIFEQVQGLDMIIVPIGGGGLIGGIATASKAISPKTQIIGVQSERYPAVAQMLSGKTVSCGKATLAEGIAVKHPGKLTLEIIKRLVDKVQVVSEELIEQAILLMLEIEKAVIEGAAGASLAELLARPKAYKNKKICLIMSGGNIDLIALASVINRGLVRKNRLVRIHLSLPDQPGALSKVVGIIAHANANIEEIHHHRAFSGLPVQSTQVEFILQTRGSEHVDEILAELNVAGYNANIVPLFGKPGK
ncbi:MAG: threonine ammonia-lyase [Myxococcales bacterium]|nr:MAG: threonine ammonia-lyase [Myxococcales bacterium]